MSSLLLVAEQFQGSLRKVTFNALGFAKDAANKLGLDLHIAVLGSGIGAVADELKGFGAKTIHVADDAVLTNYTTESHTQVLTQLVEAIDAKLIVGASTVQGKDLLPRVAGRLGAGMASDIIEMLDDGSFKRPVWAGAVVAHVKIETDRKVATIRATAFDAALPGDGSSAVEQVAVSLTDANEKLRFVNLEVTKSERPDLAEANTVVAGGRAMKDADGVKLIEALTDSFGAAMGASRAACDAGLVPNDLQIGQTGKVVAPDLYFAIGISGAIQHLAGMKSSKVIVAINKDEEAPIFQLADYGLVADLFKVVPELTEKVKAIKGS